MKGYFCKFLEDFQFPDGAKTQLVAVYDELCEKGGANLLSDLINGYKEGSLTYDVRIVVL